MPRQRAPSTRTRSLTRAECRRRALLGADWFVNTQLVTAEPAHDANHGRVVYNHHLPSGLLCRGLSWSQGRAIMCLLAAYELTGREKYLASAVYAGHYLQYALQQMDARHRRSFGSFREEIPLSRFCYPRDGIEGAFGLLMLHLFTGERDYLERCELFAKWYLREAYHGDARWVAGRVGFDDDSDHVRYSYIQAGGAPFFWHLHRLTGNGRYRSMVLRFGEGMLKRFIDPETGAVTSGRKRLRGHSHHVASITGRQFVSNDDGSMIGLTCAHAATGKRSSRFLDAAVRYGRWLMTDCPRPLPNFAGTGLHAINLTELAELTGDRGYVRSARELMADQVRLQVNAPKQPDRHGGYRGEDEPPHAYVKGATGREFLTTRVTAYSTLALFRLAGVHGPSYSCLGSLKPSKKR